jgi:ketosteroid isomerase-like protein
MRRTVLLGALGLVTGLIAQIEPTRSESADTNAIKAANAAFYAAASARDLSAIERIWAQDAQVSNIFATNKTPSFGPSGIKADYEDLLKRMVELSVVMSEPVSVRQEGDVAIVVGTETLQAKLSNGDTIKLFPLATNIFVKRGTQWLMIHHHTSRPPQ